MVDSEFYSTPDLVPDDAGAHYPLQYRDHIKHAELCKQRNRNVTQMMLKIVTLGTAPDALPAPEIRERKGKL